MFTGLIEEIGNIKNIAHGSKSCKITITAKKVLEDVKLGDSIAVNGTCLTVVNYGVDYFTADVMPETVKRTVLAKLNNGDVVNLERTMALGDRFGGHIVSGHIDGLGEIVNMKKDDNAIVITIKASSSVIKYIIEKGSVAIDGISLTVVSVDAEKFAVSIIPHTVAMTNLHYKNPGDYVNIETDVIGKYVERLMNFDNQKPTSTSKINLEFLAKNGF